MKHQFKTLLLVSILLMAGCNDTPLVEEESTNTQRTFTLSATMPGGGGPDTRVAGEQDPASLDIVLKWEVGDKIQLYFDDGSNITPGDEVVVYDISADGKTAQFQVDVTDISGNFDLYGVHGTSSETNGSAILLDVAPNNFVKLEDARVPLYFKKENFDPNSPDQSVDFEHLGALQVITFKNTSDGEITLGSPSLSFSGTDKWYYDNDPISNKLPLYDIVSGDHKTKDGTSPSPLPFTPVNISPNDNIKLAQWIMPIESTQPLGVYFIAGINGDGILTINQKDRKSALEIGKAYHLYVLWDGTALSFAEKDDVQVYKITMLTTSNQLNLDIEAAQVDQDDVWIDLNNDGIKDSNEDVTFDEHEYSIASSTVTLYGKVTSLVCSDNSLDSLDVTKNPALTVLKCSRNSIGELDVTKNPALTVLDCSNNLLEELDVLGNTELEELDCSYNNFSKLNVTKNTKLEILNCIKIGIKELNVSENTALIELDCSINSLNELDVSSNTELTNLYCSENSLTALDVSNNTGLKYLECYLNKIGSRMDELIDSLPDRSGDEEGLFYVIDLVNVAEGNVCTATQAQTATTKNWKVLNSQDEDYP